MCRGLGSDNYHCKWFGTGAEKEATVTQDVANGGYLEVTYIDQGHDAQLILRVFASGLMDLQERYGEFLEVKMFY